MIFRNLLLPMFLCLLLVESRLCAQTVKEADAAFEAGNYTAALLPYQQARGALEGNRQKKDWLDLTAKIVRTHNALGQTDHAVAEYFNYCLNDAGEAPLDCIPLPWYVPATVSAGTSRGEQLARELLNSAKMPGPAATLLAAGVLSVSSEPAQRSRGDQILGELVASLETLQIDESKPKAGPENRAVLYRRQIGLLAVALRWKQSLPQLRSANELTRMKRLLDQIDEPNRAGPLFLYGSAAARVGDRENAVLAWMRIPILYPGNRVLVLQSLKNAADALDRLERADQARQLRREAETLK